MKKNSHTLSFFYILVWHIVMMFWLFLPVGAYASNGGEGCTDDTEPPVITPTHPLLAAFGNGDSLLFQCGSQTFFSLTDVSVTDNCDTLPTLAFSETLFTGDCATVGYIISLKCCWSAIDDAGNFAQFCVFVNVIDTVPPVFDTLPPDLTVDPGMGQTVQPPLVVSAADGCDPTLQVIFSEQTLPGADSCSFTILRTWTTTDDCGNAASQTQTITVLVDCDPCALSFDQWLFTNPACAQNNGSISFTVTGTQGTLVYDWSPAVSSNHLAENLVAGNYSITVTDLANGCQIDTLLQLATTTPPSATVITTPETCLGNDGSITLNVSGGYGTLSFTWSPAVSTTNAAAGLNNNQTYHITISDEAGCSDTITNLAIGYDCDTTHFPPQPDLISLVLECPDTNLVLCTYLSELDGNADLLLICQPPVRGNISLLNDTCMIYTPDPGFEGDDSLCLLLCDDLGICDTFFFEILVEDCTQQIPCLTLPYENQFLTLGQCNQEAKVCSEWSLEETMNHDLLINGISYAGALGICSFDTILGYGFFAIPGNGLAGPYELNSWVVNGITVSDTIQDVYELINLMNQFDPAGQWSLDTMTFSITSFNTSGIYGSLKIKQLSTGEIAVLNLNTATLPAGTSFYLPVGEHQVIFINRDYTFCTDTVTTTVLCMNTEVLTDTILVNQTRSVCIVSGELPGDVQTTFLVCSSCSYAAFSLTDTCLTYTGLQQGIDSALVIQCDQFGVCDTTLVVVWVFDHDAKLPAARIDADSTGRNRPVLIDVLANDDVNGQLTSLKIVTQAGRGLAMVNADFTVTYTPFEFLRGLDAFAYELCNQQGCDTATVNLQVCEMPVVFNGFSPNGDLRNDFFTIQNIDLFPGNELSVFNRWGELVYYKANYNNDWDGTFNGNPLPSGTYFFLLKIEGYTARTGFVHLNR
jgi:gliding motility-associated-like protein